MQLIPVVIPWRVSTGRTDGLGGCLPVYQSTIGLAVLHSTQGGPVRWGCGPAYKACPLPLLFIVLNAGSMLHLGKLRLAESCFNKVIMEFAESMSDPC